MSTTITHIVGAGLAGLVAAHAWPRAPVMEAAAAPRQAHRALLRFRGEEVSALVGIPFRRVLARKSVWFNGRHVLPDIRTANLYARKVIGAPSADRSIWSVEPVVRWVAPETLYEQLVEAVGARIKWGASFDFARSDPASPVVSTAPLPVALKSMGHPEELNLRRAPITVCRYRVPGADVHQTVYFPALEHPLYRASITGDLLIAELIGTEHEGCGSWYEQMLMALGLEDAEYLDSGAQPFGKIVALPRDLQRKLLYELTARRGIYSLGRFATWRNVLLDDLPHDIAVIKSLLHYGPDHYARVLTAFGPRKDPQ